ncbi:MAG: DNA methyltransferase, partial [Oscillospiraceae bacterium]
QKSASVISEIIKTHTNINDLIFDPFSGSGEISYSALKLHRKYIACEINEEYYKSSLVRFNKEKISPAFNHIGNKRRIIEKIIDNTYNIVISILGIVIIFESGKAKIEIFESIAKIIITGYKIKNVREVDLNSYFKSFPNI